MKRAWDGFWAFWETPDLLPQRLKLFRVAFFGLLAFDLWVLMVPHASRYGAGGFNVAHFGWLGQMLPVPTPGTIGAIYLVAGALALSVALGAVHRASIVALTILYNLAYFWSQADSYQHHYLIGLVLLLLCFVPFRRLEAAQAPVSSWAMKLLYAEVSIVYLYTATTKISPQWLDGSTISSIAQDEGVRSFQAGLADFLGWEEASAWVLAAYGVMIWQWVASVSFLWKRLRPIACLTGPVFHVLVEVLGLKIGWFSYYMIAIYYILLFPDAWFRFFARPVTAVVRHVTALGEQVRLKAVCAPLRALLAAGAGAVAALATAAVPIQGATGAGILVAGIAISLVAYSQRPLRAAVGQLVIAGSMFFSVTLTDAAYDYHRFWAGDLARRGLVPHATVLYERANALRPDEPARRKKLARLYRQLGRTEDAARVEAELAALKVE